MNSEAASIRFRTADGQDGAGQSGGGRGHRPFFIVLGNEKGGSGKSTTAIHLAIALLQRGHAVACIDLDARQGTLSRMMENRRRYAADQGLKLAMPDLHRIHPSESPQREDAESEDREHFMAAVGACMRFDSVIIDTPGSANFLSRLGHQFADLLVTPMNDSFVDLDVLADIDYAGHGIKAPSIYAQMVWEQRQQRARAGRPPFDWLVLRNRLAHVDARNKREVGRVLKELSRRLGFRIVEGLGERVIFRELFPSGLTLLDLRESGSGVALQMSHVAARQELRLLLEALGCGAPVPARPERDLRQPAPGLC